MTRFPARRVFDGERWHEHAALVVADGRVGRIEAASEPTDGIIAPGFIDLQVNGGGGALLNETPTVDAISTICAAHARYGTTGLLPTLITDTPAVTDAAIAAAIEASRQNVPGFLGLHLEGPHLSVARKGAHDAALIRPMEPADLDRLVAAARALPRLVTTVAAETVTPDQIRALAAAGIIVSIGHSDAGYAEVGAAADAGATMVTHLFNAMSQLGNREPGVVGAALGDGRLWAGLIADGIHVHPATIRAALRAKTGPGRIFLVTDAMSVIGTEVGSFTLNGRIIHRTNGALRLADGTLAGADLTMIGAVAFMHRTIGLPLEEALRMASLYPAQAIGHGTGGRLRPGDPADFVCLTDQLEVVTTSVAGQPVFSAS